MTCAKGVNYLLLALRFASFLSLGSFTLKLHEVQLSRSLPWALKNFFFNLSSVMGMLSILSGLGNLSFFKGLHDTHRWIRYAMSINNALHAYWKSIGSEKIEES